MGASGRVRFVSVRRFAALVGLALAGLVALVPAAPGAAQGFESTPRFDVDITIEPSGAVLVTETIVQDFGSTPRHGIFRYIPNRLGYDDRYDRVYPIDLLEVRASPSTPDDVETKEEGGNFVIRIGDPDIEITGEHTYTIVYRVEGALNDFTDHQELYWNALGTDWEQPIGRMRVRVEGPGAVIRVACYQGPFGSTLGCTRGQIRDGVGVFVQEGLGAYTAMSVVVALPPGSAANAAPILEERWSLNRAFSRTPTTVGGSLGLMALAVGGFGWLMWKRGRDLRFRGSAVDQVMGPSRGEGETQAVPLLERGAGPVEFAPPEEIRPGQVGTLIDEEANTLDVTATIVDLAVRGYLVIEEIEKKWFLGKADWRLKRMPKEAGDLLGYERALLDGLFESGDEVELSDLKKEFGERLQKVKDALYRDVVARKWFLRRPDKVRQAWVGIGVVTSLAGVGATIALASWTKLALLGVPLAIAGLLLLTGAKWMPRRTARGSAITRRVNGFRRVIETAETHMSRWAEEENLFPRFLPFAVVFGCTDKWARAFQGLEQAAQDMSWYVSTRPFAYSEFADQVDSFAVTTSGTISATPAGSGGSGFGGGGFSGGGGGGGGGGSW